MPSEQEIVEIEAFRAGGKSARGISAAQLDEAIAAYNPESDPAPLVFGHPASDAPAHGVIASLRREGNKLITGLRGISRDAIEGVREGRFLNRSVAFWHPDHSANPTPGKWNIRHIGLLGAASPGIPGMAKLTFNADETAIESEAAPDTAVIFAEEPTPAAIIHEGAKPVPEASEPAISREEYAAVVAERDHLKSAAAETARKAEEQRKADNAAFVAGLIETGKVLPADRVLFTEILNRLPVDEVSFDADRTGGLADELRRALSGAEPRIVFSAVSPKGESSAKPMGVDEITAAAKKMIAEGKALSFEAAVEKIERGA